MKTNDRKYLLQTLVSPLLTYPCAPLNTCSIKALGRLQSVQNRGLRFALGVRYPDVQTSRTLHARAKIKPINVVLHNRAKKLWGKLEAGLAGDLETFNNITRIPVARRHARFPSSKMRAEQPEPPPIFVQADGRRPEVKAHYRT